VSRLLVDTHIALWSLGQPERLSTREVQLLSDPRNEHWISPVSVWEAAIKRESGKLDAPANLATALAADYPMLATDAKLFEAAGELPAHHRDPFDRVLVAHALRDGLEILTRDAIFSSYGLTLAA
jgi:PIN domain nuclease of toxin-antitoxin system